MRVQTSHGKRKDGGAIRRYFRHSHRNMHRESAEWCPALPVDAVEADRIVLGGFDTLLADAESLRGQLLAGRRADQERLAEEAGRAREDSAAAERAADRAEALYADADDDRCEVLLAAAAAKRREARHATTRADAALSRAIEEPEDEQADEALARVWEALSGRVRDADGNVRKLNAALREWFAAFSLWRTPTGDLWVGPILSADAVASVLRNPDRFAGYVRAVNTAGELMVEPPMLIGRQEDPAKRRPSTSPPETPLHLGEGAAPGPAGREVQASSVGRCGSARCGAVRTVVAARAPPARSCRGWAASR